MGPLFILIIWAVVAGVLSLVGGFLLSGIVGFLTRGVNAGRKRALFIAGIVPAVGFAYLFGCIIIFSIWSLYRGRDMGWGDSWDTPVLGNYHLMMIDVTERGTLYDRSDSSLYRSGSLAWGPGTRDVVDGVLRLEVRPPYLFGAAAPRASMEYPVTSPETVFFFFDTRNGARTDEPSLAALEVAAQQLGGPLHLQPVAKIYDDYRYDRYDLIPLVLLMIAPLIALFVLTRSLLRLRATRHISPSFETT